MDKPRIFLGSSGSQKKLLDALTRGLEDVAHVEPWTTSFNPGTSTLARLFELAHEVDFAAFVFARDDWTAAGLPASPPAGSGQASPRDNVVFEAGLFGGALGMHRTFILHAKALEASERSPRVYLRTVRRSERFRDESHQPEASEGDRERGPRRTHRGPVVAVLATAHGAHEPSAVSLIRIYDRDGALELRSRAWQDDGSLSRDTGAKR